LNIAKQLYILDHSGLLGRPLKRVIGMMFIGGEISVTHFINSRYFYTELSRYEKKLKKIEKSD
jgi:hypothetical protein